MKAKFLKENGLSIALLAMFLGCFGAQIVAGRAALNEELREHGRPSIALAGYLHSGHFLEATFENWESEFLQMGVFVLLTKRLFQKGSSESKKLEGDNDSEEEPREHRGEPDAPWPVRQGGLFLKLYEHSLSLLFIAAFAGSVVLHALGGLRYANEQRALQGQPAEPLSEYFRSAQFWYESFQNWQSEFLAMLAIVVFSVFLRERGSPQSKRVAAPHAETGS